MDYNQLEPQQEIHDSGMIYNLNSLYSYLLQVPGTRKAKYPLSSILILILLVLLGC